jgi:hypothetical protein
MVQPIRAAETRPQAIERIRHAVKIVIADHLLHGLEAEVKYGLVFSLMCLLGFPGMLVAQGPPPLSSEQSAWLSKARIHEKHGWKYLHIEGGPRERGFQHGYLLAQDIREGIRIQAKVWEYESAVEWPWLVRKSVELFEAKVDSENLAEMDGIVEGMLAAGVPMTREELIAYNGSTESIGYWWPTVKDSISPNAPERRKESCSSFIATGSMTADGRIVLGHNTWSTYYYAVSTVILDILPDHGHPILMQTSAGLIHSGTDFFVTGAGLVGSETTIDEFFPFDPSGVPEFSRMRRATQYASSIEEWCEMMKKGNNGGYANAWLLGDINTNEIAWFELGLKFVGFRKTQDGYFTGSNVAEDPKILRAETRIDEMNIKNADIARRVRWKQLMKARRGTIDLAAAEEFLADHVDTYLNTSAPDSRTLCGHGELDAQSAGLDSPFYPLGAYDGKVVDAAMAKKMSFRARWGSPCGLPFDAGKFLEDHPQFEWMTGLIRDRPAQPWTDFRSGE